MIVTRCAIRDRDALANSKHAYVQFGANFPITARGSVGNILVAAASITFTDIFRTRIVIVTSFGRYDNAAKIWITGCIGTNITVVTGNGFTLTDAFHTGVVSSTSIEVIAGDGFGAVHAATGFGIETVDGATISVFT